MTDFDPDWPHGHLAIKEGNTRKARFLGRIQHDGYPNAFAVFNFQNNEELWVVSDCGVSPQYGSVVNAPAPKRKFVRWLNVYKECLVLHDHPTREAADKASIGAGDRIACVRVEFEEGEGL